MYVYFLKELQHGETLAQYQHVSGCCDWLSLVSDAVLSFIDA